MAFVGERQQGDTESNINGVERDMKKCRRLCDICPGETVRVHALEMTGAMRRRLLDIGLVTDTVVECVGKSPGGNPAAYWIRGAVIAIRAEDGAKILVTEL